MSLSTTSCSSAPNAVAKVKILHKLLIDFSNLTASGILAAIAITFALIGLLKGTVRLIFTAATLSASGFAAYLVFTHGSDWLHQSWQNAPDWMPIAAAATTWLIAFLTLRSTLRFVLNPFEKSDGEKQRGSGLPGLLLGITISLVLLWVGMNQLIFQGSKQEIDFWLAQDDKNPPTELPLISQLKQTFARSSVGKHIADFHPINDPVDHTLVKIAVMRVTDTKSFAKLTTTPAIAESILNVDILAFFITPSVVKDINDNNSTALLAYPQLSKLITDKALRDSISEIDIEHSLNLR